jgi:acyl carrier protein
MMPAERRQVLDAICQICKQMFGEPDLTGEENFFELGGTSLDAVELITILNEDHGFVIEYQDVFEAKSLADLADEVLADTANPVPD